MFCFFKICIELSYNFNLNCRNQYCQDLNNFKPFSAPQPQLYIFVKTQWKISQKTHLTKP